MSTSLSITLVLAALAFAPGGAEAQGSRTGAPTTAPRTAPRATPAPDPGASARTAASASVRPWNEQEYRLGPGDKLRVEVYREPQLSQSLQIRPDGKITLPLIGDLNATGRTPIELRDAVSASLKEYVTNPVVTVIVVEAIAAQVFVVGEVSSPGTQVMQGPLTVLQALAQAGGLKEFANAGEIHILRKMTSGQQSLYFDYKAALKGKIEPIYLQPGDTVVVP